MKVRSVIVDNGKRLSRYASKLDAAGIGRAGL